MTLGQRWLANQKDGNRFDLIRFVLASMVIASHSYALLGTQVLNREPMVLLTGKMGLGTVAVHGFFLISGFLVSASLSRSQSLVRYAWHRALRIYPGFLVALLLTALVVAPRYGAHGDLLSYVWHPLVGRNLPDFPGAFPNNAVHYLNGSLWTLRFEIFCYALVPFLAVIGIYRSSGRALALWLLAYPTFLALDGGSYQLGPFEWLDELPNLTIYFLAGATGFALRDRLPHRWSLAALALLGLALTARHGLRQTMPWLGGYFLLYLALLPASRSVGQRRLERLLGDISYGMYLYAFLIQQVLVADWLPQGGPHRLLAVSFPLSLLAGVLSWTLVEKPFLRIKRTWTP